MHDMHDARSPPILMAALRHPCNLNPRNTRPFSPTRAPSLRQFPAPFPPLPPTAYILSCLVAITRHTRTRARAPPPPSHAPSLTQPAESSPENRGHTSKKSGPLPAWTCSPASQRREQGEKTKEGGGKARAIMISACRCRRLGLRACELDDNDARTHALSLSLSLSL
jgi:hypothetical protein